MRYENGREIERQKKSRDNQICDNGAQNWAATESNRTPKSSTWQNVII